MNPAWEQIKTYQDPCAGLYLGGWQAFEAQPFTHVLTVMEDPGLPFPPTLLSRLTIPVEDTPSANLLDRLPEGIEFIRSALAGNGVLFVHCAAGVSRSATVSSYAFTLPL